MKWIISFVMIFLFFYFQNIYKYFRTLSELNHLLKVFSDVNKEMNKQDVDNMYMIDSSPIRNNLIQEMPRINFVLPYGWSYLTINQDDMEMYSNFRSILSSLVSKQNEMHYNKSAIFNPITSFKNMFLLPSNVISWFGLNTSDTFQKIFSLITWILSFLIKEFLSGSFNSVIQNFVER